MFKLINLLKNRSIQLSLALTLGLFVGHFYHRPVSQTITIQDPTTKVITIEKPVITTKDILKVITDPNQKAAIKDLTAANSALHVELSSLQSTVAELNGKGGVGINGGSIVELPPVTLKKDQPKEPESYEFTDFQLSATYNPTAFNYTLKQQFIIESETGKSKDGSPFAKTKLYQVTPEGNKEVPSTTTAIFSDQQATRMMVLPRIQGGIGINQAGDKGGVVAFQWLQRGKSKANEDISLAILTPGVFVGSNIKTLTLLPISVNLGHMKHSPLTNMWVSPTIDLNKKVGVSLTATF